MRILHLSTARSWRGGEHQALLLATGLARRGHEELVACPPASPLAERARADGLEVAPLTAHGELDLLAAWRLARLVRRFRADVVHAHDAHAAATAALAGFLARRAKLVVARRVDFALRSLWKYHRAARVIAISEGVRRALAESGLETARVAVVHSGVDPERFAGRPSREAARAALDLAPDAHVAAHVAALVDHKDQRTLLAAWARVAAERPGARLLVAGAGELELELRAQAESLDIKGSVRFLGWVENVGAVLAAADAFVLSSKLEGLCTSLLDAMACSLPVAATRAGGVGEIVTRETGRLVAVGDAPALAGAVLGLFADPDARARMGEAGRARVLDEFTAERMVERTLAVYRELAEGGA